MLSFEILILLMMVTYFNYNIIIIGLLIFCILHSFHFSGYLEFVDYVGNTCVWITFSFIFLTIIIFLNTTFDTNNNFYIILHSYAKHLRNVIRIIYFKDDFNKIFSYANSPNQSFYIHFILCCWHLL